MTNYLSAGDGWQQIGTIAAGTPIYGASLNIGEIMTEPINTQPIPDPANGVIQPYIDKINELTDLNARLLTQVQEAQNNVVTATNIRNRSISKLVQFFNTLNDLDDEDLDNHLSDAGAPSPRRRYNVRYRVSGMMTQEIEGANFDDAWDSATLEVDTYAVDDLEYDDNGYEDYEQVGTTPLNNNDIARWLSTP